jgi:hypothetical protein
MIEDLSMECDGVGDGKEGGWVGGKKKQRRKAIEIM